jgi:hypothetical protein
MDKRKHNTMSPAALEIKNFTLARYKYLVDDNMSKYDQILKTALTQPDDYWETQARAQQTGTNTSF